MKSKNGFWGILLIFIGGLLILNNFLSFHFLSIRYLWPLFLLVPGLSFEIEYFTSKKNSGLLVPGGILTVLGLNFLFETYTSFQFATYTWPIYPLAVAIALFQFYLFTHRPKGLLIPIFILTGVSLFSYASVLLENSAWFSWNLLFPILLVVLGVCILLNNSKK